MSKFKVGETVWVKPKSECKLVFDWADEYYEKQFVVKKVLSRNSQHAYLLKNNKFMWCERWLESEEEHNARFNAIYTPENNEPQFYDENDASDIKLSNCEIATFEIPLNEDLKQFIKHLCGEVHKEIEKRRKEIIEMNTPKRIIFNEPATVVFWKDGSKTVAKAHNETYDPEKGLAMCYTKKALGDGYEASKKIESLVKKYYKPKQEASEEPEVKTNPVVDLAEKLNQLEHDGVVLNRSKAYRFDDGQVVKYSKKIETWVVSLDKKA